LSSSEKPASQRDSLPRFGLKPIAHKSASQRRKLCHRLLFLIILLNLLFPRFFNEYGEALKRLKERLESLIKKGEPKRKEETKGKESDKTNVLKPTQPPPRKPVNPLEQRLLGMIDAAGEMKKPGEINQRLSDVKGIDEITGEITNIIDMIKNHEQYRKKGATMTKGVLLYGKPGTGMVTAY